MDLESHAGPDWDRLYEFAASQEGLFTTRQGAEAGYSPQLLQHYVRIRRVLRIRRGIYRLVHFPPGEHEDLVAIWLWAEQAGTFSHQTALALYDLSDVLPSRIHLTLPESWRHRRLRAPDVVVLHYADLSEAECRWAGSVRVTSPMRTLNDCARDALPPDLLRQATRQAMQRGIVMEKLPLVEEALQPFGGLGLGT
ncbi:type IV toxin-antitoxin system AbiEi family antitoxin domain-containing protein [Corallococcus sp. BB11-1]|uniref:type IV toxin-antitoxin system AbiEi family antitoxin domain-containing protein n=1 Tax=Corallococcus sp. BB11-1 TaxID=2996783 RepID=UPI0010E87CE7|nr:type IV toxin-antitoxin system AbiEi family antitoxin domain-containing protein [Corallococcus sp. BB11-1]MCY1032815.1 type IV toxin-antitoxin system AbiEi family antitoxin domain-containing protein [Corallococcus sp. BB11-1]RYZ15981.1 MAG: hypothetical protein EOO70_05565 [Myxococcaceae bacterium]